MLHHELWESNADLVQSCRLHPFVRALGEGTLHADKFRNYVAQDAFFLNAFAGAYGSVVARSGDPEIVACFSELAAGVQEELKLHRTYAANLGVDLERVSPNAACRAYTEFLTETAQHRSLGETAAALAPCMSLYAYLGRELAPKWDPQHPYRDWIETYSSEEFGGLATRLESALDRMATDCEEVRAAYRHALGCELAFFSASLEY